MPHGSCVRPNAADSLLFRVYVLEEGESLPPTYLRIRV